VALVGAPSGRFRLAGSFPAMLKTIMGTTGLLRLTPGQVRQAGADLVRLSTVTNLLDGAMPVLAVHAAAGLALEVFMPQGICCLKQHVLPGVWLPVLLGRSSAGGSSSGSSSASSGGSSSASAAANGQPPAAALRRILLMRCATPPIPADELGGHLCQVVSTVESFHECNLFVVDLKGEWELQGQKEWELWGHGSDAAAC